MANPKPVPSHLKLIKGSRDSVGHRSVNKAEPTPSAKPPKPPKWLNARARAIFKTLAGRIAGMGYCSESHTEMLSLAASRLEEVETLTADIAQHGYVYEKANQTEEVLIKARPEVGQRSAAMRHAQSLLTEFGLSPSSATRVVVPSKQARNAFDDL